MKQYFLFLLLFFSFSNLDAQRFHQRLKSIISEPHDQKIPSEFSEFRNWFEKSIDDIYFTDLQFIDNQSSRFYKLGLIFRKENKFELGKTGVFIEFRDSVNGKQSPVYINYTEQMDILNYQPNFTPSDYNPNDLRKKTEYAMLVSSVSEKQIVANAINFYAPYGDKISPLKFIIDDINKRSKVKLKIDEKTPDPLDSIVKQIYLQTNELPHKLIYDLYLKDSDTNKSYKRFIDFFAMVSSPDMSDFVDDLASLRGFFQVAKGDLKLEIPNNLVQLLGDKSNETLMLLPADIHFRTIQYYQDEPFIEIKFELYKDPSSLSFKIPNEIKLNPSPIIPNNERELPIYNTSQIENISLHVYKKKALIFLNQNNSMIKIGEHLFF